MRHTSGFEFGLSLRPKDGQQPRPFTMNDARELATRQLTINNGTILGNNATIKNAAFSGGRGSSAQSTQGASGGRRS